MQLTRRYFIYTAAIAGQLQLVVSDAASQIPKPWTPWKQPTGKPPDMSTDRAYKLYQSWKNFVGPVRKSSFTGIHLEKNGSFRAVHGGADFDYNFDTRTLMVMRVLTTGAVRPVRNDALGIVANKILGKQEPCTMGGGEFYINSHPWLDELDKARSPNMNTDNLKRDFTDGDIPTGRFLLDVRWLIFWGYYWYHQSGQLAGVDESGSDRAFRSIEYLERTRPSVEKWARSLLAKGEPPNI